MASVAWLIRRLKAMSIPEVLWRLSQKRIQKQEEKKFTNNPVYITSKVFNEKLRTLEPHPKRLHLNYDNKSYSLNNEIHLLAGAKYEDYKSKWNAGFQTENSWPDTFSYKLDYKQRDDIGDARTNWELNRHFQFALLAKDYAASSDHKYLDELENLFEDWNAKNPFLHGITWTSVMEVAIRCSNWCYAYGFLAHTKASEALLCKLRIGIINMTDYVANHYSRFSSANNHLIVEAFAIGQSGIIFDHREWVDLALNLLTRELPLQNYSDGVNKELSLHYQSFFVEAMGLMMRLLIKNNIVVPFSWQPMLEKMSQYVADCVGEYGEVIVFGDNDDGKILDLQGGEINHYQYVLSMMSLLLSKRYVKTFDNETLYWLFDANDFNEAEKKEKYIAPQYCCYRKGGNTILRSKDRNVLIGVDHAALGFGTIAAHGHADALSFQLYFEGLPIFIDPGTYIYHCDIDSRNEFRKTRNHNTVNIDGKDQSEMLGAFLWGRKANCILKDCKRSGESIILKAEMDGYKPIIHSRTYQFDGNRCISIFDELTEKCNAELVLNLAPQIEVTSIINGKVQLNYGMITIMASDNTLFKESEYFFSNNYGIQQVGSRLTVNFDKAVNLTINIEEGNQSDEYSHCKKS